MQLLTEYRTKSGKFLRLPQELKDKLRKEFDEVRNEYELQNLGSFEQLYPSPDPELAKKYELMLKKAQKLYNERNGIQYSSVKI